MTARSIHSLTVLVTLVAVLSCSSDGIAPPTSTEQGVIARQSDSTLLAGLVMSGAVGNAFNPLDRGASSASVGESSGRPWVSLVPGTVPDGVEATITNLRTTQRVTREIVDGGFDPQQIIAVLDDSLEIDVSRGGKPAAAAFIRVGPKLAPRIVRTRPPRGQTDAPLNTIITIVFSEPVNPASVNATSVVLSTGGSPVAAEVRVLSGPGYTVELTPSALLAPNTTYSLTVGGVANLAGTPLDAPVSITFTTSASVSSGPDARVIVSPDSAVIEAGEQIVLKATTTNLLGDQMILPGVTWTSSAPAVASIIRGNEVVGIAPGTAAITAREPFSGVAGTVHITVTPVTTPVGAIVTTRCDGEGYCDGIYAVEPDGTRGRLLTTSGVDADPVWSPDGKFIAFRSRRGCLQAVNFGCFYELYVMKGDGSGLSADGSGVRSLTAGRGFDVGGISWSPDGGRLVFAAGPAPWDGGADDALYIVNADGSGLRRLLSAPAGGSLSWPDWSPDGSRIVYNIIALDDTSAIDIVDADGSNVVRISTPPEYNRDSRPRWSPDGKRIAFTRSWFAPGDDPTLTSHIVLMNADGSNPTQVTSGRLWEWFPEWSPDGTSLALFSRYYDGFFFVKADGTDGQPTGMLCCDYYMSSLSWRRAPAAVPAPGNSSARP